MRFRFARYLPFAFGWLVKRRIDLDAEDSYVYPAGVIRGVDADVKKVITGIDTADLNRAADRLGGFDKPALIAWSREDKLFKPAHAERLAEDLPNARLEWVDDARTFSMEDNPAQLSELDRRLRARAGVGGGVNGRTSASPQIAGALPQAGVGWLRRGAAGCLHSHGRRRMLKLSDSRNFSRTLAGIGLIVGPALFLLSNIVSPAWDDDTAKYLQEVADDKGLYLASSVLFMVGALFLIVGSLGIIKLMRRGRKVTLGQVAGFLLAFGLIVTSAWYAISIIEIEMVDSAADRAQMVALSERAEESTGAVILFVPFFFLGIVLGNILLAVATWRTRVIPRWAAAALLVSILVGFFGSEGQAGGIISFALLAVGLTPLGLKILSLSDDQWERWQVLEDEPAPAATEEQAGPGAGEPASSAAPRSSPRPDRRPRTWSPARSACRRTRGRSAAWS